MKKIREIVIGFGTILILLTNSINLADAITARVIEIYDGDMFSVNLEGETVNIVLYGIDAPESGQNGNASATRFLKRSILEHHVEIKVLETDSIGRSHAIVIRKGRGSTVNADMVAHGYSWVNPDSCIANECSYWKELESNAKNLKFGIWSGYDLVPPWEFKREKH